MKLQSEMRELLAATCSVRFGIEMEVGINQGRPPCPVKIWEALGFTPEHHVIDVNVGRLVPEAGQYMLELVTTPSLSVDGVLRNLDVLVEALQDRIGPFTFDYAERDMRFGNNNVTLDEWVPLGMGRYEAMCKAYEMMCAAVGVPADSQGFLNMARWRSTHVSFGVRRGTMQVRIADILTLITPYVYRFLWEQFRWCPTNRVNNAYGWWEPVGYGPCYLVHRDVDGFQRYLTSKVQLIRFDNHIRRYVPDLITKIKPDDDPKELHPWVRLRIDRIEWRVFPPIPREQLEKFLSIVVGIFNVVFGAVEKTMHLSPEHAWQQAFLNLRVRGVPVPCSAPNEEEWNAAMQRCP